MDSGPELSEEMMAEWVEHFPTTADPWDNKHRTAELRAYLYPQNFMPHRRQFGIPDIAAGAWAELIKGAPNSAAVIRADKVSATTQRAIEDIFRPYFAALNLIELIVSKSQFLIKSAAVFKETSS